MGRFAHPRGFWDSRVAANGGKAGPRASSSVVACPALLRRRPMGVRAASQIKYRASIAAKKSPGRHGQPTADPIQEPCEVPRPALQSGTIAHRAERPAGGRARAHARREGLRPAILRKHFPHSDYLLAQAVGGVFARWCRYIAIYWRRVSTSFGLAAGKLRDRNTR
jgi:hypothetical protein